MQSLLPTAHAQLPQQLDDAFLEIVRTRLLEVERTVQPLGNPAQHTLDSLADRLLSLRSIGFSFREISGFLAQCGVVLPENVIRDYFSRNFGKRLVACEQTIVDYYRPQWNKAVERTAFIEDSLHKALREGHGLVLHYQPQIDTRSGRVLGAEALLRWEDNGTLIHPAEFIPVAEGSGLIVEMGEWVLREACREAKRWESMGLGGEEGLTIGVNLSVKQFSDSLPDMIHGVLCDTGLSTKNLGLEITESFLMGEESRSVLHALRDSGVHLSIDDFGTGYSCLSQLHELPLDTIKIDRAFVMHLEPGGVPSPVIETIINLAGELGMTTLAEGVETEYQAEALRKMGCSVFQGFLYSKALPPDGFVQYVSNSLKSANDSHSY